MGCTGCQWQWKSKPIDLQNAGFAINITGNDDDADGVCEDPVVEGEDCHVVVGCKPDELEHEALVRANAPNGQYNIELWHGGQKRDTIGHFNRPNQGQPAVGGVIGASYWEGLRLDCGDEYEIRFIDINTGVADGTAVFECTACSSGGE